MSSPTSAQVNRNVGMTVSAEQGPILLYDGVCGFCDRTVQFVLGHDPKGVIRFATLQGTFAENVMTRHPELRNVDSLMVVEWAEGQERVSTRTDALLRIAQHVGGDLSWVRVLRFVPRFLRNFGYDQFARVRYRVFGRYDSCPIPSPDVRSRFID